MNEAELTALSIAIGALKREGFREDAEVLKKLRTQLSLADGGKGEADAFNRKLRVQLEQEWGDLQNLKRAYAAPQAECAPREAQPIYQARTIGTTSWTDQSKDGYDHMSKYPACFETRIAAPTPDERADANKAGAKLRLAIAQDQASILEKWAKEWEKDQFQRAHDARIIADNLVKLASERADAEGQRSPAGAVYKDAARYRWLRGEHFPTADKPPVAQVVWKMLGNRHSPKWVNLIDGNNLDEAIDAAIAEERRNERRTD